MHRASARQHRHQRGGNLKLLFATGCHALKLKRMSLRNTTARWGALSQLLHWAIVVLIIMQYLLIETAHNLPRTSGMRLEMLARHKSFGITVLMLAIVRLLWRAVNPTPLLPNTLKPYERWLANGAHLALYGLIFALPLTGWMMSSARNFPVSWFGLWQLPDLIAPSKPLYSLLHETHETLFWVLVGVAALHVLAALKHHFLLKDDVLRRMLPFTRTPP